MLMTKTSRRGFLRSAIAGSALMPAILQELLAADAPVVDPLAARPPHFPARAQRVIFLFMSGGVSHVDSFDHKPRLFADHGQTVALDHPETRNRPGYERLFLKRPQWTFRRHGQSGLEVSTLFPHIATRADDLCLIRSMHCDHSNHYNATLGMHTGSFNFARPSIGSWVSYGLGTPNRNLPSFIAIAPFSPYAGGQVWASDFLPGSHQGTLVVPGPEPMRNVRPAVSPPQQQRELSALAELNRMHQEQRGPDPALAARIRAFETAFGMQTEQRNAGSLRLAARQHPGVRLAMPGRAPPGRARRPFHRVDRFGRVEQLGRPWRHDRPARPAGPQCRSPDRRPARRPQTPRHA
jgi:Protein of unknown function (DUF1501)